MEELLAIVEICERRRGRLDTKERVADNAMVQELWQGLEMVAKHVIMLREDSDAGK